MRHAWQLTALALLAGAIFIAGAISRPTLSRLRDHSVRMQSNDPNAVYDSDHYQRRSSQFAELGANRPLVFLGDSRIEGAEWSELFQRSDISNRGISGDTTAGMLRRLTTSMPNEATLCVLQAGVNDLELGVPVDRVVSNYEQIMRYVIDQRHCRAVVTSILRVDKNRAALNARVNDCNQRLAQLTTRAGADWLDLNLLLAPDGFLAPEFTNDGAHLNGKGYVRMRDALAPLLPPRAVVAQ